MFGKYSPEAIKGISSERTKKANDAILKLGGEIVAQYALLGDKDLVFIVNLPGVNLMKFFHRNIGAIYLKI